MQKELTTQIIKSKITDKKTLTSLVDEFIKLQSITTKTYLESFLSDLLIYVNKNFDSKDKDTLLTIVQSKLSEFNIPFETKQLESIYEKIALTASVGSTKIVFNKTDIKAIESMRKSFYWVGNEYNQNTQAKLTDVIESAYQGDVNRADISILLKKEFENIIDADVRYFEGVADHIINQSQNISRVNQALKYDVKYFKVRARIDKKTSTICRSMHGKIIEASHLDNQVENILNAKSIGEKKGAALWSSKAVFGKLDKNFGLPPYHFRCRTGVEPVWISEDIIDGKIVKYTDKRKDDIITHIDKTGVQRRVDAKVFGHSISSKARTTPKSDVISALNSINEIAPHSGFFNRAVAKSSNGYFMVFEADKLITLYKPTNSKGKSNLDNHFKTNAIIDKKEVIKWNNTQSTLETPGQSKTLTILIKLLNLMK